nr:zinc finger, CCHC-type [Tanacetum cinerariifolium]
MVDSRPVLEQYNELLDFKHTLKHLNEELNLVELGSHPRIDDPLWRRIMTSQRATMLLVLQLSIWWSITTPPGETVHVYKDRFWFKSYESMNDGSILHMGNESTSLVYGRGCVDLSVSDQIEFRVAIAF